MSGNLRGWIRVHRVRCAVYVFVLAAFLAGGAAAVLFLTGGDRGVAAWAATRGPVRDWLAARGLRYGFESLAIGGLRSPCPFELRARGVRFQLAGPPDARGAAGSVAGCLASGFELTAVQSGVAGFEVAVARVQAAPVPGRYAAAGIRISDAAGPVYTQRSAAVRLPGEIVLEDGALLQLATVGRIRVSGFALPAALGSPLRLAAVDVAQVRAALDENAWNEARVRNWQAALAELAGLPRTALGRAARVVVDGQQLLGWAVLTAAAFFFALKLLVAGVALSWWRLPLAAAAVAPAALLYFALRPAAGPLTLLVAAALYAAAGATVLYALVYRRAPAWHQRWEPVLVDIAAPPVLMLLLIGWGYPVRLPPFAWPRTVEVDRVSVSDVGIGVRALACGPGELARLDVPAAEARDVRVALDPERLAVESFAARAAARGEVRGGPLPRVAFCAAIDAGAAAASPPELPPCEAAGDSVAIAAALGLDTKDFSFTYDARAFARVQGVALHAALDGGPRAARIRSLRTEGASRLRIASGAGRVRLAPPIGSSLALRGLAGEIAGASISTGAAALQGSVGGSCTAPSWNVSATARGLRAGLPDRWSVEAADSSLKASSRDSSIAIESSVEGLSLGAGAWLKAALPRVRSTLRAKTAGGLLPRAAQGTASVEVSGRDGRNLLALAPVGFQVDLAAREFRLPQQEWLLKQALARELPGTLGGSLAAAPAWEPGLQRAHGDAALRSTAGPADLRAAWTYSTRGFDYRADASLAALRLPLPVLPAGFSIRRAGVLDLETTGTLGGLRLDGPLRGHIDRLLSAGALRLPSTQEALVLSVEATAANGVVEATITGGPGLGLRLAGLRLVPERVVFEDGALAGFAAAANIGRIQTLDGRGSLAADSSFRLLHNGVEARASLRDGQGGPLLETAAALEADTLRLRSARPFRLARLWPAMQPYLRHFGWELRDWEPLAAIDSFDARLRLEDGALASAAGAVSLGPGPLLRGSAAESFLRRAEVSLDQRGALSFDYRPAAADVTAAFDGMRIEAWDAGGAAHRIGATFRAEAAAALLTSPAPESALGRAAAGALRDFAGHLDEAARVFGAARSSVPGASWDARVRNAFVDLDGERAGARFDAEIRHLRLRAAGGDWVIGGAAGLRGSASLFRQHLMLDAHAPLDLELLTPAGARARLRFDEPFALALAPELRPSASPRRLLFDTDYYAALFRDFPRQYARETAAGVLAPQRLALAGFSVDDASFALTPLFAAIGHRGALQICPAPFAGRIAYGAARGEAHTELRWGAEQALVELALESQFAGVQAAGFRFDFGGGNALLDHRLDGSVFLRATALPVSGASLRTLIEEPGESPLLGGFLLNVRAASSREPGNIGIVQAGARADLPELNEALRRVIRDLTLRAGAESLRFREMEFDLDVAGGQVNLERPLLRLSGLQLAAGGLHSETEIRVHLGRASPALKPYSLAELAGFLRRLTAFDAIRAVPEENR